MKTKVFILLITLLIILFCFSACDTPATIHTPMEYVASAVKPTATNIVNTSVDSNESQTKYGDINIDSKVKPITPQTNNNIALTAVDHLHTVVIDEAVKPTCIKSGLTEGMHCSICGMVIKAQEKIKALQHTEVIDKPVKPTCTEPGLTVGIHCSSCNKVFMPQQKIEATGHTEVIDSAVEPTCIRFGLTEGSHCSVCNEVIKAQERIKALQHTEVIDKPVKPTCTEPGLTVGIHCSSCNKVFMPQQEIKATGHTEVIDSAVEPTCIRFGLTEGSHCSVCNEVIKAQERIKALQHTEVIDKPVKPTCTEPGLTVGIHCSSCNKVFMPQQEVEALGHTEVIDAEVKPTTKKEGLTEGKHCSVCGEILVAQKPIPMLKPNEIQFPSGIITTEPTIIETNHLRFNIPENVYIPDNFIDNVNLITSIMEEVSGMKFEGNPQYASDLLEVTVKKNTETEGELAPGACAYHGGFTIYSGDLIEMSSLIHECSHSLHFNQSPWMYSTLSEESISTYTTYKTQKYIELHYPDLVPTVGIANSSLNNYEIENYDELYKHPLDYWMVNKFENGLNNNYSIGFAFAWYLDETYDDYIKWITEYEKIYPNYNKIQLGNRLPIEEQIKAYKISYGDEIFEDFYTWLKNNESIYNNVPLNLKDAESIQIYPKFSYTFTTYNFHSFSSNVQYNNLIVDISAGKKYLSEYKGKNTDDLILNITDGVIVEFYDQSGNLLKTEGSESDKPLSNRYSKSFSLDGASYIKLVGEGEFREISITGFN